MILGMALLVQHEELAQARGSINVLGTMVAETHLGKLETYVDLARRTADDHVQVGVLDETLDWVYGHPVHKSKEFHKNLTLALKTGYRVSGQNGIYEIIPIGRGLLVLEAGPRPLPVILLSIWPILLVSGILMLAGIVLAHRAGILCTLRDRDCRDFLQQLVDRDGNQASLQWLLRQTKTRWQQMEQKIREAEEAMRVQGEETETLRITLRKTGQDLKTVRENLVQAGTLTALGEFAASISHELNNPLGIVLGFAQDLLDDVPSEHPYYPKLKRIETELSRSQRIIKDLLAFARPSDPAFRQVDIDELVRETVKFAFYSGVKGTEVSLDLEEGLPPVLVDPEQLEQVLLNLFKNAIEAMPEGGNLEISTSSMRLTTEDYFQLTVLVQQPARLLLGGQDQNKSRRTPKINGDIEPGGHAVSIRVRDTGEGIDPEHLQEVFTPFFTTKKKGGTGLGLSICWKLISRNGGLLKVDSIKGKGSTFNIILPIREQN